MLKYIRSIFKKDKVDDPLTAENMFKDDSIKNEGFHIIEKTKQTIKDYSEILENLDENKDTILIIDDNEGMVSFLEDDMEYFDEIGILDIDNINVLSLTGNHVAFAFKDIISIKENLSIKWAIIDITLGGSKMTEEGNVKYTGVDVYEMLHEINPEAKFLFYTGNNLNPYIKSNKRLIDQFNKITGEDIKDHVLFKTSMDINKRRDFIVETLFKNK